MRIRYSLATVMMLAVLCGSVQAQAIAHSRDRAANLTDATYDPGFAVDPLLFAGTFSTATPFSFSVQGPAGNFMVSGYSIDMIALSGDDWATGQHQYSVRDLVINSQLMPGVELNIGYNLDVAGPFGGYGSQLSAAYTAYNELLSPAAAVNWPSLAISGNYLGSTVALSDSVRLRFGEFVFEPQQLEVPAFSYVALLREPQSFLDLGLARSSLAGIDWNFASWGGLGVVATETSEQRGLFGGEFNPVMMSTTKSANISTVGISARVGFGDGWVTTFSYNEGITQLSLKPNAMANSSNVLHSRAYGFAIAKHGLFGDDDSLGLAVTRPLQMYAGGTNIASADGANANPGDLKMGREYVPLSSAAPETDLELGYVTTFMDGALALQANAGYQMNVAGVGGTNALSVISRAKINF